jgi:formylglycine-generating enzyme required for sulfatase activity
MPVTVAQWRTELAGLANGAGDGYFCPIAASDYQIGSGDDDPDAQDNEKPQHTVTLPQDYGIARFPITNAQWAAWVDAGGTASRYANDDDLNHANQPVVGVTWHEANAFCAWLTAQLADVLPEGVVVRLPSEAEWEAAARGPEVWRYPWGNEWRDDRAAMLDDQQTRGANWTVPVGCYPAGAAACGALDFAGNIWEWTLDRWQSYPGAGKPFTSDKFVVLRGGGYNTNRTYVRCGARGQNLPVDRSLGYGFRVVVSPPLAHMS